jgi:uncharacterized protein (DUF1501 family)
MGISRRDLLRAAAAGAAAALVGLPRKSGAQAMTARYRRLLVLYVEGGWRCSMALKASSKPDLNPFGPATPAGPCKVGPIMMQSQDMVSYDAPSWPGSPTVPDILTAAPSLSVLHAHPAPLDPLLLEDDHYPTGRRVCTGWDDPQRPGLFNLLSASGIGGALPPILIGSPVTSAFMMQGPPDSMPVVMDPRSPLPAPPDPNEHFRKLRELVESNLVSRRPAALTRALLNTYRSFRATASDHGRVLSQPEFNGTDPANDGVDVQGISNGMLKEAAGIADGSLDSLLALGAIRALQFDSRAVLLSYAGATGGFDLHSGELQDAPRIYPTLGRLISGLMWLLDNVPNADASGSLGDETVLVVLSEFGRLTEDAPFNAADGSDHNGTRVDRVRNQSVFLYGGGVPQGQLIGPDVDEDYVMVGGARPISMQCLWATLLAGLGVRQDIVDGAFPPAASNTLYPEGAPLPLWG